ncbi:peptide methionine sulfoxide reductase-like [Sitodiplosis mosellana]|uniref:peptide methionine sulfoxide reductase-like n=1 Tax=Sitodiplosis mosellana TaxID=263140 RepID=UPI002444B289|nr:peptide methionine sulfoxide reductase-like [Sitodiplosis mosellana]XP_055305558.1 peptide methionine sulfoxide reductase-like [Sitodiplosis mosellana]
MVKFFSCLLKKRNMVGSLPVHYVDTKYEKATFGMGCFWSGESLFGGQIGVLRTKVGYSGGTSPTAKYREIGDHVECVSVDYDPKKISYKQLLDLFWNNHEYGLTKRVKRQYSSLILYHTDAQKQAAMESIQEERVKRAPEIIITEIAEAGPFHPAEDYHQKFRLQAHKEFVKSLQLNSELLLKSFVAAKLNGYLVGVGGLKQFEKESSELGLSPTQLEYVRKYVIKNAGAGLSC